MKLSFKDNLIHYGKACIKYIFQKEIIAAIVLIFGYWYTSDQQLRLERFKIKSEIYSQAIRSFNKSDISTIEDIDRYNETLSNLYIYASDCVIREINNALEYDNGVPHTGLEFLMKVKLILHNDVNDINKCGDGVKPKLSPSDFPWVEKSISFK